MAPPAARIPNTAFKLAPDWVCEVVSPATARLERLGKMPIYARAGVGHLWLVDPLVHTLEVYRLDAGSRLVAQALGGSDKIRAEPFDAIEIDLSRWWLDGAPTRL